MSRPAWQPAIFKLQFLSSLFRNINNLLRQRYCRHMKITVNLPAYTIGATGFFNDLPNITTYFLQYIVSIRPSFHTQLYLAGNNIGHIRLYLKLAYRSHKTIVTTGQIPYTQNNFRPGRSRIFAPMHRRCPGMICFTKQSKMQPVVTNYMCYNTCLQLLLIKFGTLLNMQFYKRCQILKSYSRSLQRILRQICLPQKISQSFFTAGAFNHLRLQISKLTAACSYAKAGQTKRSTFFFHSSQYLQAAPRNKALLMPAARCFQSCRYAQRTVIIAALRHCIKMRPAHNCRQVRLTPLKSTN